MPRLCWLVRVDGGASSSSARLLPAMLRALPEDEARAAQRFVHAIDRQRAAVARTATRAALHLLTGR